MPKAQVPNKSQVSNSNAKRSGFRILDLFGHWKLEIGHSRLRRKGFSLLEVIVAVGIFSAVMTMLSGIFISTDRLVERTRRAQVQSRDARSILEFITREFRSAEINWSAYGAAGMNGAQTRLALRRPDVDRTQILFFQSDAGTAALCASTDATPCLLFGVDLDHNGSIDSDRGEVTSLHGADFRIPLFQAYISPSSDPFVIDDRTGAVVPNQQPRLTVSFTTEGVGGHALERTRDVWQTTVASRLYRR